MSRYLVSVQRRIDASPQQCFDLVADPAMHPVIDGSGTIRAARAGNPARLGPGARFGMDMKLGRSYRITNWVVEFDEPHVIAWRHFNGHLWRYRFETDHGATLVTEQWDATRVWNRPFLVLARFPKRNRDGMQATLERLADAVQSR